MPEGAADRSAARPQTQAQAQSGGDRQSAAENEGRKLPGRPPAGAPDPAFTSPPPAPAPAPAVPVVPSTPRAASTSGERPSAGYREFGP